MKKVLISLIIASVIVNSGVVAFAAGNTVQNTKSVSTNSSVATKLKTSTAIEGRDTTQLTGLVKQITTILENLNSSQTSTASTDAKIKQYDTIASQLSTLMSQLQGSQAVLKPIISEITTKYPQLNQPLGQFIVLVQKVGQDESTKTQLTNTLNSYIKAKDSKSASTVLQKLSAVNSQLVQDVNSAGSLLNQINTIVKNASSSDVSNTTNNSTVTQDGTNSNSKGTAVATTTTAAAVTTTAASVSIYQDGTNVKFLPAHWGSITASIIKDGMGGTSCIKYSDLKNNPYSPGPTILFAEPIDISAITGEADLQLTLNTGTTPFSQGVRVVFNGDESLNVVTPALGTTNVFKTVNVDISNILQKLGGKITKISFEGAGPNGWQSVNNLYVKNVSIVTPTVGQPLPLMTQVAPSKVAPVSHPVSIYSKDTKIKFNKATWGSIKVSVNNGVIYYSDLNNNVYAQSPAVVFTKPVNISGTANTDKLEIGLSLGEKSPAQPIKIIFNGDPSLSITTPKISGRKDFQTIDLDISRIKNQLGGQIAQISFESAGPNGWNNVKVLQISDISIVNASDSTTTDAQPSRSSTTTLSK